MRNPGVLARTYLQYLILMLDVEKSEADRVWGGLHGWCQMEDKQRQSGEFGSWEVLAAARLANDCRGPREWLELISEELQ